MNDGPHDKRARFFRLFLTRAWAVFFAVITVPVLAHGQQEACEAAPSSPSTVTLRVRIHEVRSALGVVRLALCSSAQCYDRQTGFAASMVKPARTDMFEAIFPCLAKGEYALLLYHDENDNHVFDRGFLGIPLEGFGFSRDPGVLFGRPSFEQVRFSLGAPQESIMVTMRYFQGAPSSGEDKP